MSKTVKKLVTQEAKNIEISTHDREDSEAIAQIEENEFLKTFHFPQYEISIKAKNYNEALKKINSLIKK